MKFLASVYFTKPKQKDGFVITDISLEIEADYKTISDTTIGIETYLAGFTVFNGRTIDRVSVTKV